MTKIKNDPNSYPKRCFLVTLSGIGDTNPQLSLKLPKMSFKLKQFLSAAKQIKPPFFICKLIEAPGRGDYISKLLL